MSNQNTKVRATIQNSKKGDLSATFELFLKYLSGTDVDLKKSEAENYFKKCLKALEVDNTAEERPKNKITINKLKLINFRQFSNFSIAFDENLTVIVGSNGVGKTSILDGLAKTFSFINARIIKYKRNGKSLAFSDVKVNCYSNAEVITQLKFGSKTLYNASLTHPDDAITNPKDSELEEYQNFSNFFRVLNDFQRNKDLDEINIPLFASYLVERSQKNSEKSFDLEKLTNVNFSSRFVAIDKTATDGTANLEKFLEWYVALDNLTQYSKSEKEIDALKIEVASLAELINSNEHPLRGLYEEKKEELENRKDSGINDIKKIQLALKSNIEKAIVNAIPEINRMFVDKSSGRAQVKVEFDNVAINLMHIAKGQQVVLSLVADIARRLTLLNPALNNPLNGQGVILIDEVELHLHPSWQQVVLSGLVKTFPNIQFIVTTHSPQILTTVPHNSIRILRNGKVYNTAINTLGEESKIALEDIMGVDSRPQDPMSEKLKKYLEKLNRGETVSTEVLNLRIELDKYYGKSHSKLQLADMVINRWLAINKKSTE
jgi:predicted ATP-binding protein involved in virulence